MDYGAKFVFLIALHHLKDVNLAPPQAKNTHHIILMLHHRQKQNNWFKQSACATHVALHRE
jgi:hypothetical protein